MKISLHIEDITPEDLPKLVVMLTNVNICKQESTDETPNLEGVDLRYLSKGGSKSKLQIPFHYSAERAKYQQAIRICKRYGKPYPEAIKLYDAEMANKGAGKPGIVDGHFNKWRIPFDATTETSKYEYARRVCSKLNLPYDEAVKLGKMWPGPHKEWQIPFHSKTQIKEYGAAYAMCRKYNLPYSEALKKKEEEELNKVPETHPPSLVTPVDDGVSPNSKWKIPFPALGEDGKQTEDYRVALAICHKYQLPYPDAVKRQQEDFDGVIHAKEKTEPDITVIKQPETEPETPEAKPEILKSPPDRKGRTEPMPIFTHVKMRMEVVSKFQPGKIGLIREKKRSKELGDRYRVSFGTSEVWISHENLKLWVEDK